MIAKQQPKQQPKEHVLERSAALSLGKDSSEVSTGFMFKSEEGKNFLFTFALICLLFFLAAFGIRTPVRPNVGRL